MTATVTPIRATHATRVVNLHPKRHPDPAAIHFALQQLDPGQQERALATAAYALALGWDRLPVAVRAVAEGNPLLHDLVKAGLA